MVGEQDGGVRVVVCLPTFRRPAELGLTLASLAAQKASFAIAVIVADNDFDRGEGKAVAEQWFAEGQLTGQAVLEPKQGHCHAVNAAFDLARKAYPLADFFLMIDDDEIAEPQWAERLVNRAVTSGADLVGGPVLRKFERSVSDSLRFHPVFTSLAGESGPVPVIYGSGNFLVRRRVFDGLDSPHFDTRFNHMGGGDMEFFRRCRNQGFSFQWDADAIAHETVPSSRMRNQWVLRRSLHIGAINYTADLKHARGVAGLIKLQLKNIGSFGLGVLRSVGVLWRTRRPLLASYPILVAMGRVLASYGFTPKPYKAPPFGSGKQNGTL
jgi:glycosyltransferase involved in cell wall biosynthesis